MEPLEQRRHRRSVRGVAELFSVAFFPIVSSETFVEEFPSLMNRFGWKEALSFSSSVSSHFLFLCREWRWVRVFVGRTDVERSTSIGSVFSVTSSKAARWPGRQTRQQSDGAPLVRLLFPPNRPPSITNRRRGARSSKRLFFATLSNRIEDCDAPQRFKVKPLRNSPPSRSVPRATFGAI